ncbi:MAG: cytochrome c [Magnetococcales bacterium]|nr:cytochrome c [Magnetococcales bacterium]
MSNRSILPMALVTLLIAPGCALAADPFVGKDHYQHHCAQCHGLEGKAGLPRGPDFTRKSDPGNGLMRSDSVLLTRIRQGGIGCPSFRGVLDDLQILDVVSFLRSMKR